MAAKFKVGGVRILPNTDASQVNAVELAAKNNLHAISVQSPDTLAASITYKLPGALGTSGQVLTDAAGTGVLSWTSSGGGGSSAFGPNGTVQASDGAGAFIAAFLGLSLTPVGSTGTENNALGTDALGINTTGFDGTAIGKGALASNTSGSRNVAIGRDAMFSNDSGGDNVAIGRDALGQDVAGSDNVAVGWKAGNATTGGSNVYLGEEAGSLHIGNGCVFLGATSGQNTTEDDKLYIDNTAGASPLIGGDFAARTVKLTTPRIYDIVFASLPSAANGTMQYCSDAKNLVDNAALVGSVAVGGGNGNMLVRINGSWRTMA